MSKLIVREAEVRRAKAYTQGHRSRDGESGDKNLGFRSVCFSFHWTSLPGWRFDYKSTLSGRSGSRMQWKGEIRVQETVNRIKGMR